MTTLKVLRLPKTNILRLEQVGGRDFFISSDKLLIIDIVQLATILRFLVKQGYLSKKVLEGILSEVNE